MWWRVWESNRQPRAWPVLSMVCGRLLDLQLWDFICHFWLARHMCKRGRALTALRKQQQLQDSCMWWTEFLSIPQCLQKSLAWSLHYKAVLWSQQSGLLLTGVMGFSGRELASKKGCHIFVGLWYLSVAQLEEIQQRKPLSSLLLPGSKHYNRTLAAEFFLHAKKCAAVTSLLCVVV